MIEFIIICFIAGSIGGLLSGMLGVGTGIVTVPLLTLLLPHYGISQNNAIHIALATSMAAIAINSITAIIKHHQYGNIRWDCVNKSIVFSLAGAFLGALTASYLSGYLLQIIFGIFLLLTAVYMLIKKTSVTNEETTNHLPLSTLASGGFGIGFIASIIGSGGGIFMVPFLCALKIKMRYAIGTSILISLPVAICGAFTYIVVGWSKIPLTVDTIGYLHWPALLAISATAMLFTPIGVRFATVLPTIILQRVFAVCIIIVSLKMLA